MKLGVSDVYLKHIRYQKCTPSCLVDRDNLFYMAGLFILVALVLFLDDMREREPHMLVCLQYIIHAGGVGSQ